MAGVAQVWGAAACDENARGSVRLGGRRRAGPDSTAAASKRRRRGWVQGGQRAQAKTKTCQHTNIEEEDLGILPARAIERRGRHC